MRVPSFLFEQTWPNIFSLQIKGGSNCHNNILWYLQVKTNNIVYQNWLVCLQFCLFRPLKKTVLTSLQLTRPFPDSMRRLGRECLHLRLQTVSSGLLVPGGYSASILGGKNTSFSSLPVSLRCPELAFYHNKIPRYSLCRNAAPSQRQGTPWVLRFLECLVTLPGISGAVGHTGCTLWVYDHFLFWLNVGDGVTVFPFWIPFWNNVYYNNVCYNNTNIMYQITNNVCYNNV